MKILLADDHTLFRDALMGYIARAEPHAKITTVPSLDSAQHVLDDDPKYDLCLLDWRMPGVTGLDDFKHMVDVYPDVKFALMSGVIETHEAQAAMNIGLWGYFPKTLSGRGLVDGIQKILQGQRFIPMQNGSGKLQPAYQTTPMFYRADRMQAAALSLSPREREVITHLCTGLRNEEIAHKIGITLATVKLHVRNSYKKMGARNRTEAMIKARSMGIVS